MALKYLGHETRQLGHPTSWTRIGPPVNEVGLVDLEVEVEMLSSNPTGNTDNPYWGFFVDFLSSFGQVAVWYFKLGYDRSHQRPV